MRGTTGTASTVVTLSPAEEKKTDKDRLLTALINVCGVPYVRCKDHPIVLALKHDGIALFHANFIHTTSSDIDALQYDKGGTLGPLELNFKMILRAFLAFYHHQSHKKRGIIISPTRSVEVLISSTLLQDNSRISVTPSMILPRTLHHGA